MVYFAAALGARGHQVGVFTLLDYLVPELDPVPTTATDPRFARVGIAARIVESLPSWCARSWPPTRSQDRAKIERLRTWARHCAELGALRPVPRATVGRVLGMLGDDRKGVGLDADGLPDIDWVKIKPPKGKAYSIARYPVTNVQFDAFVTDGGYTAKWDACWTKAGLAWRHLHPKPRELLHPFSLPNHPRVEVTLHEAVAFANWVGSRGKDSIGYARLPTVGEWQSAARGGTGRRWAWGNDEGYGDGSRQNTQAADIRSTCAVGTFPQGATPDFGVHDLSGNAQTWALRSEDTEGEQVGSILGSSWGSGPADLRMVIDVDCDAAFRSGYLGFRLAQGM